MVEQSENCIQHKTLRIIEKNLILLGALWSSLYMEGERIKNTKFCESQVRLDQLSIACVRWKQFWGSLLLRSKKG